MGYALPGDEAVFYREADMLFQSRAWRWALIGVLCAPLLLYVANSVHMRLMVDDFSFVGSAQRSGLWQSVVNVYYQWQGAFSTTFLSAASGLLPLSLQLPFAALMTALWWAACAGLFRLWLVDRGLPYAGEYAALGASLLLTAVMAGMPAPGQSFYWQNGRMGYWVPVVLATCALWLLFQRRWRSPSLLAGLFALGVIIGGFSITYDAILIVVWGVVLLVAGSSPGQQILRNRALFLLAGLLLGTLLYFIAPGNAARQAYFPPPDLLLTLSASLQSMGAPLVVSAALAPLAVACAALGPGMLAYHLERRPSQRDRLFMLLVITLITIAASSATSSATGFYAVSDALPARAWVMSQFVALLGTMISSYVVGMLLKRRANVRISRLMQAGLTGLLLLAAATAFSTGLNVGADLRIYAAEWDRMDATLRAAAGTSAIINVPTFSVTFGLDNISSTDPQFWVNSSIAAYYGVRGVLGE